MEQLKQQLRAEDIAYRENEPLAAHCTFKIGGPANVFAQPETEEQLCRTIALCRECGVKYYLLGNGSNILFEDAGYHGVVIDTTALKMGIGILENVYHPGAAPGEVYDAVAAGAGLKLSALCAAALENGLTPEEQKKDKQTMPGMGENPFDQVFLVTPSGVEAALTERLLEKARYHFDAVLCESLDEAVKQAKANSRRGLLVCGSEAIALEAAKLLETI